MVCAVAYRTSGGEYKCVNREVIDCQSSSTLLAMNPVRPHLRTEKKSCESITQVCYETLKNLAQQLR